MSISLQGAGRGEHPVLPVDCSPQSHGAGNGVGPGVLCRGYGPRASSGDTRCASTGPRAPCCPERGPGILKGLLPWGGVGTVGAAQGKARAQALPCGLLMCRGRRRRWEQGSSWQAPVGQGEEVPECTRRLGAPLGAGPAPPSAPVGPRLPRAAGSSLGSQDGRRELAESSRQVPTEAEQRVQEEASQIFSSACLRSSSHRWLLVSPQVGTS